MLIEADYYKFRSRGGLLMRSSTTEIATVGDTGHRGIIVPLLYDGVVMSANERSMFPRGDLIKFPISLLDTDSQFNKFASQLIGSSAVEGMLEGQRPLFVDLGDEEVSKWDSVYQTAVQYWAEITPRD